MSALRPFDGPCCLIRRVLIPPDHKRCSACLSVIPRASFGAHQSYCKTCRRSQWHTRHTPQELAA